MASTDWKKYLGSGVLIVDTKSSSLVLVHDYTDNYNCCGGYIKYEYDDPQRIVKTAKDELYEETRTLFSYEIEYLLTCPFVDLNFHDDIFRCYILKIECESDICQQFQNINLGAISDDDDYRETSSMQFFPLKQFQNQKSLSKIDRTSKAKSITGEKNPLNPRVISVIKAAINENLL